VKPRPTYALLASACLVFTLGLISCRPAPPPKPSGPPVAPSAVLKPDALYDVKATVNYGGTVVNVKMERTVDGDLVRFILSSYGQALETEVYQSTPSAFSLVSIDEVFNPPIDLLRFPMNIGDTWEWKGTLTTGTVTHNATAKITTEEEQLFLKGSTGIFTDLSEVTLQIDSGAANPAVRTLRFWFNRGRGIVKRELPGITREPVAGS